MKTVLLAVVLFVAGSVLAADVLIYTKFGQKKGQYIHSCVKPCAHAVKELCERNGLTTEITDDPGVMTPERLKQVKTIVLASNNNEIVDTDAQRKALMDYVANGGGLVSIHSALASERSCRRFREMVGSTFVMHPSQQPFDVEVIDAGHRILKDVNSADWKGWVDELYVCETAPNIHVVMSADLSKLKDAQKVLDKGFKIVPVVYTVPFGKGRSVVLTPGHNDADYQKLQWRKLIENAILWSLER